MKTIKNLSFQQGTEEHVREIILSIDGSKAIPLRDIFCRRAKNFTRYASFTNSETH